MRRSEAKHLWHHALLCHTRQNTRVLLILKKWYQFFFFFAGAQKKRTCALSQRKGRAPHCHQAGGGEVSPVGGGQPARGGRSSMTMMTQMLLHKAVLLPRAHDHDNDDTYMTPFGRFDLQSRSA